MSIYKPIEHLQGLTADQRVSAKEDTFKLIRKLNGDKPKRDDFKRDYSSLFDIRTVILFIVFFAAFVPSFMKVGEYVALTSIKPDDVNIEMQINNGERVSYGIVFAENTRITLLQLSYNLLSEFSMIFFMIMWNREHKLFNGTDKNTSQKIGSWLFLNKFGLLAVVIMVFVMQANLAVTTNTWMAVLPPLVTIAIGFYIEELITTFLDRKQEIDDKYSIALAQWTELDVNPDTHPKYKNMLAESIWQRLTKIKANKDYANTITTHQKAMAIHRELQSEYAYDETYINRMVQIANESRDTDDTDNDAPVPTNIKKTKKQVALEWYRDNPNLDWSYAKVADELKLNKATVWQAHKAYKEEMSNES